MKAMWILALALTLLPVMPAQAQTKAAGGDAADTMRVLREKLKADKKLVVSANMALTDGEAKGFWPVYEEYQKELQKLNERTAAAIIAYAKEYNAASLTDAKAKSLLDQYLGIEESELKMKRAFVPKLSKVLPGQKVARYMQIENKIRAVVKYELAAEVPLVQ